MNVTRWTLGVVLAAAVSLFGLLEADASPFSSYVLVDDLSNMINGTAPDVEEWEFDGGGNGNGNGQETNSGQSNNDNSGDGQETNSGDGQETNSGHGQETNDGHGNNDDGVDSSNQGASGDQLGGDESCPDPDNCVDDESSGGNGNGNGN